MSYFKSFLAIAISYLTVVLLSQIFFLGNTPIIRSHPEQYLANSMSNMMSNLLAKVGISNGAITANDYKEFISNSAATGLKQVAPGTYAAQIKDKPVQVFIPDEVPTTQYTFTVNGQQVTIYTKSDNSVPSNEDQLQILKELQEDNQSN